MSDLRDASDVAIVKGACPHDCPDTCAVLTEVQDGRAVKFVGDPDNSITRGWLCSVSWTPRWAASGS